MRSFLVKLLVPTLALSTSVGSIACGSSESPEDAEPELVKSSVDRNVAPTAPAADLSTLTQDNANFAFDLYRSAAKKDADKNFFFSPHSISVALAMTFAGAKGATAQEIAQTLHFSLPAEQFHSAVNALDLTLSSRGQRAETTEGKPFRLRVVNSLWGNKGTAFLTPFLDTLAANYGAGIRVTDFVSAPEASRVTINRWTSRQTENRINDLIPENVISAATRLVLVNAIYFNAEWASKFDVAVTKSKPFARTDGTSQDVDTMNRQVEVSYAESDTYQAVELPYVGRETSMVVVLPKEGTWATFEPSLDGALYQKITHDLAPAVANVSLPKFKIADSTMSLKDELSALGMPTAFNGNADFSGIVAPSEESLYIKDVVHKAYVSVDEKGTEAAAATAVIMDKVSMPDNVKTFNANRPFFFFVRDIPTGVVLFMGRVTDPQR